MRFFKRWQHVKLHKLESSGWTFAPFCANFLNRLRALSRAQSQICLGHIGSAGHVLFWISDRKFWPPFGWFSLFSTENKGFWWTFFRFASSNWEAPGPLKTMDVWISWSFERSNNTLPETNINFYPWKWIRLIRRRSGYPVSFLGGQFGAVLVRYQGFCQEFPCQKIHGRLELLNGPRNFRQRWGRKKLLPWTRWKMPKVPTMRLESKAVEVKW